MTRMEELEQIEIEARKKEAMAKERIAFARKKHKKNWRKTFKRSAINDVGFIASATRGSAVMLDKTFNAALFMNGMNQTMIGLVDDWAGQFGGYTKHSVGDKMFAWTLKGATILEKATVSGITKIADYSEKKLKKEIMYARLRSRTRA